MGIDIDKMFEIHVQIPLMAYPSQGYMNHKDTSAQREVVRITIVPILDAPYHSVVNSTHVIRFFGIIQRGSINQTKLSQILLWHGNIFHGC